MKWITEDEKIIRVCCGSTHGMHVQVLAQINICALVTHERGEVVFRSHGQRFETLELT